MLAKEIIQIKIYICEYEINYIYHKLKIICILEFLVEAALREIHLVQPFPRLEIDAQSMLVIIYQSTDWQIKKQTSSPYEGEQTGTLIQCHYKYKLVQQSEGLFSELYQNFNPCLWSSYLLPRNLPKAVVLNWRHHSSRYFGSHSDWEALIGN